jgi:hypothetical protein
MFPISLLIAAEVGQGRLRVNSDVSDFAHLIAAEVGQGRLRVKAGHAVTVGESGGYFHRPLSGDEMQVMQLPDASKIRFQNGHQYTSRLGQ